MVRDGGFGTAMITLETETGKLVPPGLKRAVTIRMVTPCARRTFLHLSAFLSDIRAKSSVDKLRNRISSPEQS